MLLMGSLTSLKKFAINDFSLCHDGFCISNIFICILQHCNLLSFYGKKSDAKSIW